jgi:hypothetical protein
MHVTIWVVNLTTIRHVGTCALAYRLWKYNVNPFSVTFAEIAFTSGVRLGSTISKLITIPINIK